MHSESFLYEVRDETIHVCQINEHGYVFSHALFDPTFMKVKSYFLAGIAKGASDHLAVRLIKAF